MHPWQSATSNCVKEKAGGAASQEGARVRCCLQVMGFVEDTPRDLSSGSSADMIVGVIGGGCGRGDSAICGGLMISLAQATLIQRVTHTFSHTHSLSRSHTHTHTHSLSLSRCLTPLSGSGMNERNKSDACEGKNSDEEN